MKLITTITPIKIACSSGGLSRTVGRLELQMQSLRAQRCRHKIESIVCDASSEREISFDIENLCKKYNAKYIHIGSTLVWNKPLCLNVGIKCSNRGSMYIATLDADIIYRDDTFAKCANKCKQKTVVLSQSFFHTKASVNSNFSPKNFASIIKRSSGRMHIKAGNGGIQFFERAWLFKVRGYDERYSLWGGPDNEIIRRATQDGLKTEWVGPGMLIHLHHTRHVLGTLDSRTAANYRINYNVKAYKEKKIIIMPNKHWGNEKHIIGPRLISGKIQVPSYGEVWG